MQAVDEDAPVSVEKKPAPQVVHEADPVALWYRPDEQAAQLLAPVNEKRPSPQAVHVVENIASTTAEYNPATQLWQLWLLWLIEYWPLGHVSEQDEDPADENVPVLQNMHTRAAAAEYVFEAHNEQPVAPAALKVPAIH